MSDELESSAVERHMSTQEQVANVLRNEMQPAPVEEETQTEAEEEVVQEVVEEQPLEATDSPEETEQQTEEANVAIDTLTDLATAIEVDNDFLYGIKIPLADGQEPVTLSELKDAYQGKLESQSVTSSQLDEQRKAFEQEKVDFQQQVATQMSQVQQMPDELLNAEAEVRAIASQYQNYNWEDLEKQDAGRAALEKQKMATMYSQAEARVNGMKQELAQNQQQANQEMRVKQEAELLQVIPEWKNSEVRTAEGAKLANLLQEYGYTDAEINNLYDSRTVKMLRDYHTLKAKFNEATETKRTVMKTPKSLKPGAPRVSDSAKQKLAAKIDKARASKDNKVKVSAISDILANRG